MSVVHHIVFVVITIFLSNQCQGYKRELKWYHGYFTTEDETTPTEGDQTTTIEETTHGFTLGNHYGHIPVRLTYGSYGYLEVYYRGRWGRVCHDHYMSEYQFNPVCRYLGYPSANDISRRYDSSYGILTNLQCVSNDYNANGIDHCSGRNLGNNNYCSYKIYIRCDSLTTEATTTSITVSSGQTGVRLVGGYYRWEGRVELYHNGQWGTICDDSFDRQDAQVICSMLGYSRYDVTSYSSARFGVGYGRIMLDELNCNGYETDISQCSSRGWYTNDCSHSEDAGVSCQYPKSYEYESSSVRGWYRETTESTFTLGNHYGHIPIRLANGSSGLLEVYYRGRWGYVCHDQYISSYLFNPVCRYLGYPSANFVTRTYETDPAILTDLTCNSNYNYYSSGIDHCSGRNLGSNNYCSYKIYVECDELSTELPMTSPMYTGVRLVGGTYSWEGRVELYHNGQWGTICDDDFDTRDAQVICAMLGYYRYGSVTAYQNARFGEGYGSIMLDNLQCNGNEADVSQCRSNGWYSNNCGHSEDASVSCKYPKSGGSTGVTVQYEETTTMSSYTLGSHYGHISIRLTNGNYGLLEVYGRGRWGYVCFNNNLFSYMFNPVCQYLGYPSIRYVGSRYETDPAILTDLTCSSYNYYNSYGIDHCSGRDLGSDNYCSKKIYIDCESLSTEEPMTTTFSTGCESVSYNPADLVFVVDESGSVGQTDYDRTKRSIVDTIRHLDVQNDLIRVGLIKFDDSYYDVFYLSSYIRRPADMERSVMQMSYSSGGTDIAVALRHACQFYFQQSYGDRTNAQNYIVLLTDGQSSAQQAANECKAKGIKIITVGIGDGIDEAALRGLAYTSDYYISTNYTEIVGFLPRLVTTAVNCGGLEKTDAKYINVNCQHSSWYVKVHIPPLEQKYSGFNDGDVYLGQHSCTGHRSGDYLVFDEDYAACGTSETTTQNGVIYKNTLIYAVHDRYQPFIVHEYRFQINVECDMSKIEGNENLIYNHHGVTQQAVAGAGHFPVQLKFYSDKNYQHEFNGFPPSYMVGQNVYVSAQTPIHDYNVKMRLSECFTKPSKYASEKYTYYIIRNGCPAEPNTFISLTRTHETRFHFQDFEYAFKPDSMYVYCNATFCPVNDYSNACEPRCHSKRVANDVEDSSGVTIDREQTNGPIDYAEDEAVIYFRSGSKAASKTGQKPVTKDDGKPLYVVGAVVTGIAMLVILAVVSLYFRSKRNQNRRGEAKVV